MHTRTALTAALGLAVLYRFPLSATFRISCNRPGHAVPEAVDIPGPGRVCDQLLRHLGLGSFAATILFKLAQVVPDELLPGTLNVGHTLPTMLQAILYIGLVEVSPRTLLCHILSSICHAWSGVGIVARLPRRGCIRVGCALVASVGFLTMAQFASTPESLQAWPWEVPAVRLAARGERCL